MLGIPDLGEIQAYLEELRTQAQRDRAARQVLRARSAVRSPLRSRLGRIVQTLASVRGEAAGSEPPGGRFPVGLLKQATLNAVRIVGKAARGGEDAACHCLDAGRVLGLDRRNQTLVVSQGQAWIAFGGKDFVVNEGERLHLRAGRELALISSVGGRSLCFEVG